MTNEEKKLLQKLASGELDGFVGNDVATSGGSTVWKAIKNGLPAMFKQGPEGMFFNGQENERYEGVWYCQELCAKTFADSGRMKSVGNRDVVQSCL